MRFFSRPSRRSGAISAGLGVLMSMLPLTASARADSPYSWSDNDFALYPPYCNAKLNDRAKDQELFWKQRLGPENFLHIHHFCFGLKALTMAYASFNDVPTRNSLANGVITNFNYILKHTQRDFFMRGDAMLNLGRGYLLLKEYSDARDMFEAALKFNPDMVDAWVALSDLYFQTGKKEDALRTLEEAVERVGEHKKISLRIEELKKAGVKTVR